MSQYCDFWVDLRQDHAFSKNIRGDLRKAGERLTVEMSTDLALFYRLYTKTMHHLGTPQLDFDYFRDMTARLDYFIVLARLDGILTNANLFIGFKDIAKWENSAYEPEYATLQGNTLLVVRGMEEARRRGYTRLLFGRTLLDSGVYRFKKKWGFEEVSFDVYKYLFNYSEKGKDPRKNPLYRIAAGLWKRTPAWITDRIGGKVRKKLGA
jgi:lipid II:glycine glycyltransferase (peptidoglycan interpeptide bridge formation enzyme)